LDGLQVRQQRRHCRTQVGFDNDGNGTADETVGYEYNAGGLRTKLTLPGSLSVTYTYNQRGQLVSLTDWDSQRTVLAYDNIGRMVTAERANALRSRYTYDAGGRLRMLRHTAGKKTLAHFAYEVDKRGNRTQALEALPHPATTTDTTIAYNDKSLVTRGRWANVSSFKETTDFGAALTFVFMGDIATLTMGTGPDHSIYDVYIGRTLWQSFDGYAVSAGQRDIDITALAHEGPHVVEIRNRPENNLSSIGLKLRFKQLLVADRTDDVRTLKYTYDALSRLLEARTVPGLNGDAVDADLLRRDLYTYDRAGNRLSQAVALNGGSAVTTNYTYNAANQLTNDGTHTLTYDANGNLTNDGVNAYTWDRANRMLSMGGASFAYDGNGQRISQTVSSVATKYLLDVQPQLAYVIAATTGGNTDRYVHGPMGIHSMEDAAGNWEYPVQDGLHSVRSVINNALDVLWTGSPEPYGKYYDEVGTRQLAFLFTGEWMDESGWQYHRARYYGPSLGVFASRDPFEGVAGRPMSLNGYSWVEGNPANRIDPSGMYDWYTFTVEEGDNLSCIAAEGGVPYKAYAEFQRQVIDLSNLTNQPISDPNLLLVGQQVFVPNEVIAENIAIYNIVDVGRSGAFRYASPCWLRRHSTVASSNMLQTPTPPSASLPSMTCPPLPNMSPTSTPNPGPKVITGGARLDTTVIGPTGLGVDLNLEWHCAPYYGECGWFLNMSGEANTSIPGSISANGNLGVVLGLMGWPQNVGDYSLVLTAGGSSGAFITAWGLPLESDIQFVPSSGDVIFFVGGGPNISPTPSGYVAGGASIYFGHDLQNIPEFAIERARDLFNTLVQFNELPQ
jgi:RHS repeat-associated protein